MICPTCKEEGERSKVTVYPGGLYSCSSWHGGSVIDQPVYAHGPVEGCDFGKS